MRRFIFIGLIVTLVGFAGLMTIIDQFGFIDRARPADVIVLLGSQVYPGGKIGPSLERRAQHAAALYRRGLAAHVLCSGGVEQGQVVSEAAVACGRVIELGVPASAILYEDQSHSTEENAVYSTALMRARGWRSAVVDTDGFHLLRATLILERAGVTVYPSPAQATTGPMDPVERIAREMREALGLAWFGLRATLGLDLTAK